MAEPCTHKDITPDSDNEFVGKCNGCAVRMYCLGGQWDVSLPLRDPLYDRTTMSIVYHTCGCTYRGRFATDLRRLDPCARCAMAIPAHVFDQFRGPVRQCACGDMTRAKPHCSKDQ